MELLLQLLQILQEVVIDLPDGVLCFQRLCLLEILLLLLNGPILVEEEVEVDEEVDQVVHHLQVVLVLHLQILQIALFLCQTL